MRLTTIVLVVSFLQVSAAGMAQKVSLSEKGTSLSIVINKIKAQAGIDFVMSTDALAGTRPVYIQVKQRELSEVLKELFKDQPLDYSIEDNFIVIKRKQPSVFDRLQNSFIGLLHNIQARGRVTDMQGRPLAGATVSVKGSAIKTRANDNGEFSLSAINEKSVLVINFIGFIPKELRVSSEFMNVKLEEMVGELSEVNVVGNGYQQISKERAAGSFTQVNMDVVANRSISMNVLQSLDGLVPGLVVNNVPLRNQLLIRGISTTGGSTGGGTTAQPLYVLDGLAVPYTNENDNIPDIILSLNPQDVKDITVLKDATAASIWGARAANGVIVITTKKGAFNSQMRINYNGFVNFQGKPNLDYIKMLSPRQYVDAGVEMFNAAHPSWQSISTLNGGGITPLEVILYNQERGLISADQAARSIDSLANTDNRKQIKDLFYRNAMLSNHTLSLSGGGDKYSFYASGSYTNTVSNEPGEKNQTYKINFRQDFRPLKFLSFYTLTDVSTNTASAKKSFDYDYTFYPYQLFRDANGRNLSIPFLTNQSDSVIRSSEARSRISLDYNPLNELDYNNTKTEAWVARLNGGLRLDIYKGLRFEGTYGYIKTKNKSRQYEDQRAFDVRREVVTFTVAANPATTPRYYLPSTGGRLTNISGDQHKWDVRNQLIFDNTFGKHAITVLAGQEAQEHFVTSYQTRVRGFDENLLIPSSVDFVTIASPVMSTVLPNISTLASSMINDSFATNETTTRFTSYYANFGYTFDRKYTINAAWRNDQSNLFGKDKSAQNKPIWSVGAKWNAGNEAFMKNVPWVQRLALRLTYGLTGNSPNVGVAASQDITGPTGSPFFPGSIGMRIITPGNPDLSWESTKTTNLGIDFSVLNERLTASIDLYNKKTTDLLGLVYPNSLTGFTSIVGNQGDITNRGIESNIQSLNVRSRNFSWTTNWVFAYNKNIVDRLSTLTPVTTGAQRVQSVLAEDFPAYALFAYQYSGLDNTGAPLVKLADGSVTATRSVTKPEDIAYAGTTQPVWNGGLTNSFQYKNFRLSANMVYNMGHVMRRQRYLNFSSEWRRNVSVDYLNRWQTPGDETRTNIPGVVYSSANEVYYFTQGDVNVTNASFLKLRDVTLFYDLPKSLLRPIHVQGITFRAQLSNVLLWTANKYDIDPEFQGLLAPTNQNTVSFGVNISL